MRGRACRSGGRAAPAVLAALLLVTLAPRPARALHKESPPAYRITEGSSHPHPQTRSWGNYFAFSSADDLAQNGNNRREIFVFNMAYYDCFQGSTFPTTPCPNPLRPFLYQVTFGPGDPENPSLALPLDTQTENSQWLAFDARGNLLGATGPAAARRQIFLKDLVTGEVRQITFAADGDSVRPSVNAHGGIVVFESTAQLTLGPTPAGTSQIYVYETKSRLLRQITFGRGPSTRPITNQLGQVIAFQSTANLLGNGADTGVPQIFWSNYDRATHTSVLHQLTRGNGPSQRPFLSEVDSFIAFDSSATNLPGTPGTVGTSVFMSSPLAGATQPPAFRQLTFPNTFGACSSSMIGAGSLADHIGFICTGDPLRNGTIGNRVFIFELSTLTLMQITGTGDVQPPIGGNIGNWFVTMSTTSPLGSRGGCGYQLSVLDYLGDLQPGHDTKWVPATQPGQLPPDVVPASGGGSTGSTLIGKRNFNVLRSDGVAGSQASIATRDGASNVPLVAAGILPLVIGGADGFAHQASIHIPRDQILLPPIAVGGNLMICLRATADGDGLIDCDGGEGGGDLRVTQYQNDGTSPGRQILELPGTFASGGMRLKLPVTVSVSADPGAMDHRFCTDDDDYVVAGVPATLRLTTGSSETTILDADSTAGVNLTVSDSGAPFNCGALQAGTMAGARLVGAIPLLDFPQGAVLRDTIVSLRLDPQPDDRSCRQPCTQDPDCGDGNSCNGVETCVDGFCVAGTPRNCDDGDPCNGRETCDAATGQCVPGPPCDDLNPCNGVETCSLATGCQPGTPIVCVDADLCDGQNTCDPSTGACVPSPPPICNDGNPCTDDSCDPAVGCLHANNAGSCDDGNGCTAADVCVNGTCTGTVVPCDDGNACNGFETCDPLTGACVPTLAPTCDDGNPCTDDACDAQLGCLYVNNNIACNSGSLCTTNDACFGGACTGIPRVCTDGNVCNGVEYCNPLTGGCQPGSPLVCNDNNVCTDDSCDPTLGCLFTNNTRACNDLSLCTTGDTCVGGDCVGTPVACDDGNPCNGVEFCDSLSGSCLPGTPVDCNDGNACTIDLCDPARGGCIHTVTAPGTVCLLDTLSSTLTSVDPALLGGPRRRGRFVTRIDNVRAQLRRAAAVTDPTVAAGRYRSAYRGLAQFQARVRKGIFRWNFDVTISNELIGRAANLMGALQNLITPP